MLTEVLEYGYEGLIKAAKQNFNTLLNAPLVFYSLSLFECFLKVFNLHPNAVPLFNLIYNADTEAISVMEVHPPRKGRERGKEKKNNNKGKNQIIILLLYVSRMN